MTRNEEIFEEKEFYRAEILKMSKKIDDVYWLRSIYVFLNIAEIKNRPCTFSVQGFSLLGTKKM